MKTKRLVLGVTLGGSSRLLDGQAEYFKNLGYDVYLISQDHYKETKFCEKEGIKHLPVDIVADINPLKDIKALFQIIKQFKRIRPDIVNVGTPKMGLLGMMAAYILGVNKRIYTCRGLRFETEAGFLRWILMRMERLTVAMSHKVIYVSPSLRDTALKNGVADKKKATVIGRGSSNGVDISSFSRAQINPAKRKALLDKYDLRGKLVIGFVGRVTLHKGAYELVEAFEELYKTHTSICLILMGHIKCEADFEERFRAHPGIIHIPFQDDVSLYMSLFDIFVLPSWREGFPNVPIQAAAMGIPVIVSDATGCVDSVSKNENGLVFKMKDTTDLRSKMYEYIRNQSLRESHGEAGIKWARKFYRRTIWDGIAHIYS